MSDQDEAPPTTKNEALPGEQITLVSGATVALFRDVEPGVHGLIFTKGEVKTSLKLSDAALQAVVALAGRDGAMCWTVA